LAAIRVMFNVFHADKADGSHRSVRYPKYKSNSEYAAMFDEKIHMGCDYISDIVVERAMEGLDVFCAIKRRPTHTKAVGWENHYA
jgi:hypothetical protein